MSSINFNEDATNGKEYNFISPLYENKITNDVSINTTTFSATDINCVNLNVSNEASIHVLITDFDTEDKNFTINKVGLAASANLAGMSVEEDSLITAYFQTSNDRNSWVMKSPNTAGVITLTPGVSGFTIDQAPITSHSSLNDLSNDDHSQYALLNGRIGDVLKIDEINEQNVTTGVQVNNILLNDKIMRMNINGLVGSADNTTIYVEEDGIDTGYLKLNNATRDGLEYKSSDSAGIITLKPNINGFQLSELSNRLIVSSSDGIQGDYIYTDVINEKTTDHGIDIESIHVEDGIL